MHITLLSKHIDTNRHRGVRSGQRLLLLLLTACLPLFASAAKQPKSGFDYVMKMNRSALSVVDSTVIVSLQMTAIQDVPSPHSVVLVPELTDTLSGRKVTFPMVFINSRNQQIYFDRHLKTVYPDALAYQKKKGKNLDIEYLRSVKYEPWMEKAVLKLKKQDCACDHPREQSEMVVAQLDNTPPVINLFPVYLLPPADTTVKVREEHGSAYLCFVVNKWDIKPDYMNNPVELQKIHNSVNLVKNDSDVTIRKMTIEGYASPEASYEHNRMLSEKRTEALKSYLQKTNIAKDIQIEANGRGENWEGFIKALRDSSNIPQCSTLLSIATSDLSPDEKERKMRKETPEGFQYVLKNIFPALRCTNYTVVYTVRPFTIEESERVFETRPANLNLNEIYKLAGKYANDEEKYYSIIRKAYMLYPNDSYINLTMSFLAIRKESADEAAEYLQKVHDCPEKTMNEGLVAWLKGDTDKARQLVEQARQQGVKQAVQQLEEFAKLKSKK